MRLDYGTLTSPYPIAMTIGTIRKPTLGEIADPRVLGFETFGLYESFLAMTPEEYYTKIAKGDKAERWGSLSEEEKSSITMFAVIEQDEALQKIYTQILQFFFEEPVVYQQGFFIILNGNESVEKKFSAEGIRGLITEESFHQIINILKQICGMRIDEDEEDITQMKFKNKKARSIFERMQKAKKVQQSEKGHNPDFSLPNIISAVCTRHNSINYTNVYQLTVYQLMDTFDRLRNDAFYEISSTSVSVWGDEKKTFKSDAWYKNEYDKK